MENCLRCGAKANEKHRYCPYCGAPLKNLCTNDGGLLGKPCTNSNPQNAAYCTKCGSATAFNKAGLIPGAYPESKVLEQDEAGEMNHFNSPFFR